MRRIAAFALVLLLCFVAAFSGMAQAEERITLSFTHIQDAYLTKMSIQNSVDRFMADHPGVDVRVSVLTNDIYKRRVAILAMNNDLPDIFVTWGGAMLKDYVSAGLVYDITDSLSGETYERFLPHALDNVTIDDRVWGVPLENIALAAVFYNTALFERYEITPPNTFDELLEIVDLLRANGVIPFALANRNGWTISMYYMYLVDRLGGVHALDEAMQRNADGTPVDGMGFEAPVFLEAWQLFCELIEHDAFPEDGNFMDTDAGDGRNLMYDEKAAMCIMGSWTINQMKNENEAFLKKIDFFPFPSVLGETPENRLMGTVGDNCYSVSSSCKHPELASELISYLIDETALSERWESGLVTPVIESLENLDRLEPILAKLVAYEQQSTNIQLWYDQALPLKLAEVHKQVCRDMFSGMTPEQAVTTLESAARDYYAED